MTQPSEACYDFQTKRSPLARFISLQVVVYESQNVSCLSCICFCISKTCIGVETYCELIPRNVSNMNCNMAVLLGTVGTNWLANCRSLTLGLGKHCWLSEVCTQRSGWVWPASQLAAPLIALNAAISFSDAKGFFVMDTLFAHVDWSEMVSILWLLICDLKALGVLSILYSTKLTIANSPFAIRKTLSELFYCSFIHRATTTDDGVINMCSHDSYQILLIIAKEIQTVVKLATLKSYFTDSFIKSMIPIQRSIICTIHVSQNFYHCRWINPRDAPCWLFGI